MIDPTTIKPDSRYSTTEAAEILELSPKWFKVLAERNKIQPINPGGIPLYWIGSDLWKLVKYQPKYVPVGVVQRSTKESMAAIQDMKKRLAQERKQLRVRDRSATSTPSTGTVGT
ncbi:MAG: hypothetical protein U0798_15255 [Gemmataceae bacterium]